MKTQFILSLILIFNISIISAQQCVPDWTTQVPKGNDGGSDPVYLPNPSYTGQPMPQNEHLRMVYWLHGLNGTQEAWLAPSVVSEQEVPGSGFTPRKLRSQRIDYSFSEDQGLDLVGSVAHSEFDIHPDVEQNPNYDWKEGFIIAHSQGGLVSRTMDMRFTTGLEDDSYQKFKGILTFGTPNQGAQIINNKWMVISMLQKLARDMSAGPLSELKHSDKVFVRLTSQLILTRELENRLLSIFSNDLGKYLFNTNYPRITDDYQVDADFVNELNTYVPSPTPTDIVAFFGIRDTLTFEENVPFVDDDGTARNLEELPVPISWATLHYFINPVSATEAFTAEQEEHLTALEAFRWKHDYQAKVDEHNETVENLISNPLTKFSVFWLEKLINAKQKLNEWQKGVDYLNNFDQMYRVLIGARVSDSYQVNKDICVCTDNNGEEIRVENIMPGEDCSSYEWPGVNCTLSIQPVSEGFFWTHKASDGVVLAESANNIPQATFAPQIMPGSTHMRMRNDEELRQALLNVYNGNVGDFFFTEEVE